MSFNPSYDPDFGDLPLEEKEFESINQETIFLVDGNEQMFINSFFTECVKTYRNIIRQKCSQNKKDKLGLFLFGTKETNCEINNLMVLQKFDTITIDSLKNIKSILKDGNDKFEKLSCTSKYSFYDILSYTFQQLHISKINANTRNIILLCTCIDNPGFDDVEQCRIEHLLSTFKDTQTELHVAGFSDTWNDEIYYKDLQIISGTFTTDDYRRMHLLEFEDHILKPARSICKLPWKISDNIRIEVSIFNIIAAPKYPSKIKLEKEGNEFLETRHILCKKLPEDSGIFSQNLKETVKSNRVITDESIMYYKTFGGVDITFTPSEYKKIKHLGLEQCIEILAFKPISIDPLYHVGPAYFVRYNKDCSHESKLFFMALISKCTSMKVMPICKVVTKYTVLICQMIPSDDDGGFYMYKIPYKDNVRDLSEKLKDFAYDSESECPINEEAVDLFGQLMKLQEVPFNPRLFKNPKLEKCLAHIEALALDEKLESLPPDSTCPPPFSDEAEALKNKLIDMLDLRESYEISKKRPKSQIIDDNDKKIKLNVKDVAEKQMLHTLTVVDLKQFLKHVNLSTQGNKAVLIDRAYKYFESTTS